MFTAPSTRSHPIVMHERITDTIFAPATPVNGTITIVRLSGPAVRFVLETMAGAVPRPRHMTLRSLRDSAGNVLDRALVVLFPGPDSFTGEDCAELHLHGGRAVLAAIVAVLAAMQGLRPAQPGEFSRRAFLNGRMDLTEAEGLADLLSAETEAQRRQALGLLEGRLGEAVESWRARLVQGLALAEADLDFSDERDVPEGLLTRVRDAATSVAAEIDAALAGFTHGERVRDGYRIVIAGPPNAGKSSLLNALAQRDVAIVSDHAGTTRDLIEVRCDIGGLPVTFVDTAGLRDSDDPVEQIGIARAREAAAKADLTLWLEPVGSPVAAQQPVPGALRVATKADLGLQNHAGGADIAISVVTGQGLPDMLETVTRRLDSQPQRMPSLVTRQRHAAALGRCRDALHRVVMADQASPELVAEDLRAAAAALGMVTGRISSDDVLDALFGAFCIGK